MASELVIATGNQGKLREIQLLLADVPVTMTSLADYPDHPEINENGSSFEENALIKAKTVAAFTGKWTLGEDSGLEVDALDGRPGIYSARFSGVDGTDEKNNTHLLTSLKGVPMDQRTARYQCCAVIVHGEKTLAVVQEKCEGMITTEPRGLNGFGYDPFFLIEEYGQTFGELDPAIKSKISHRAKALNKLKIILKQLCVSC